ncbi:hypothetical protein O181_076555 [Austropuccinia psidii MF-1]|uniref:Uncharacterized protein n=1 Tax=Austropuccinia psidii MF-1 TaxID=1389203 RepID=A0A9Q3FGG4_9BASI|nr:hypothetical protein [Austropuccinia psidii MF-1]
MSHKSRCKELPFDSMTENSSAIRLVRRRMGVPHTFPNIDGCPGGLCGVLLGSIPKSLLARADPCAAQDLADQFVDATENKENNLTDSTISQMIEVAKALCEAERNVPPDYKNNSLPLFAFWCQKAPRHDVLKNLIMKQDPSTPEGSNFFNPTTGEVVAPGSDPHTRPFGSIQNNTSSGTADTTLKQTNTSLNTTPSPSNTTGTVTNSTRN